MRNTVFSDQVRKRSKSCLKYQATSVVETDQNTPNYGTGCLDLAVCDGQLTLIHDEDAQLDALVRAGISSQDSKGFGVDFRSLRGFTMPWLAETVALIRMLRSVYLLEKVTFRTKINVEVFSCQPLDYGNIEFSIGLHVDQVVVSVV